MKTLTLSFNFLKDYKRCLNLISMSFFVSLCFGVIFNIFGPFLSFGALCLLLVVYLFLVKFEIMFFAFLILRPALDFASQWGLNLGNSTVNVASIITMIFNVAALFFILRQKKSISLPLEIKIFSIFLALSLISTIFYFDVIKWSGLFAFFRLISIFFIMLIILQEFKTFGKIEKLINILLCSLIMPVLSGILQIFNFIKYLDGRMTGCFPHPNAFAAYLSIFIIIFYSILMLKDEMNFKNKILLWIIETVLVICLFLTYARGALLSTIIAIIIITLFYVRKKSFLFFCFPIIAMTIFCLHIGGYPLLTSVMKRFEDVKVWELSGVLNTGENSLGWRVLYWQEILRQAFDSPIAPIAGHGLASVESRGEYVAHNNYLQLFFDTGLGVLFFVGFLFMFLKRAINSFRVINNQYKFLYVGTIGIIIFYLILSFSESLIRNTVLHIYFISFLTLIICLQRLATYKGLKNINNG